MVHVGAFGAVGARIGEEELDLGGPRQRAVLGLLVATGPRVVSTDRFVEELYDGEPPPRALGALQAYVSHLRRRLEPGRERRSAATVLVSAAPGYRLALPTESVDVWHFADLARRAGAAATDEEALALADGALGLWVDEPFAAYADAGWAATERDRLRDLREATVRVRARAAWGLGRPAEVVALLAPHLQDHPLDEQAAELLALAHYREGRQARALDVVRAVRERLADELGVDPGAGLRELETDMLRQAERLEAPAPRPAATPVPAAEAAPPSVTTEDLVGRGVELERLRRLAGATGVVWVEGEAGLGKTTLVRRFADECAGRRPVVWGRCPEVAGAPPAWPWVEVLAALRGEPATRPQDAFEVAHALAAELGAGPPPVVVLDDVHRADDATLQVLRQLATPGVPALLVLTLRGDERGPGLGATAAALSAATVERLALRGLDDAAAAQLVRRHAGDRAGDPLVGELVGRAGGNPLFLRELGLTAAQGGPPAALPEAVRDVIGRRTQRLPEQAVAVLGLASVLGRDVDVDALVAMASTTGTAEEDEVLDALDTAYVSGLLEQHDGEGLRFAHVLVRDAVHAQLPPLRRRRWHQAAAAALPATGAAPERVAVHAAAGLDSRTAAESAAVLDAAGLALLRGAPRVAAGHLDAAVRAHGLAGRETTVSLASRRALVRAWAAAGEWTRAREARRGSVAAARAALADGTASWRDVAAAWVTGAPAITTPRPSHEDNAEEVAGIREALAATDPGSDPVLHVELVVALVHELELTEPEELGGLAAAAVVRARDLGDTELECLALDAQSFLLFAHPEPERRAAVLAVGDRMLELSGGLGMESWAGLAHFHLHATAVGRGDLGTAAVHIAEALRIGSTGQLPVLLANARAFEGTEALVRGDTEAARERYLAAVTAIAAEGQPNREAIDLYTRACVGLASGPIVDLVPELRRHHGVSPWQWHDLLVCALLQAGETEQARAVYRPQRWPRNATWLFTAVVQVLNAILLDDHPTVQERRADLLPWSGLLARTLNGALVLGPVDLALAGAAAYLGDDAAVRHHQEQAARLAARTGSPMWAAEARADLAARLSGPR